MPSGSHPLPATAHVHADVVFTVASVPLGNQIRTISSLCHKPLMIPEVPQPHTDSPNPSLEIGASSLLAMSSRVLALSVCHSPNLIRLFTYLPYFYLHDPQEFLQELYLLLAKRRLV